MQSPCSGCKWTSCRNGICKTFEGWFLADWEENCKRLADACGADLQELRHNFRAGASKGRKFDG